MVFNEFFFQLHKFSAIISWPRWEIIHTHITYRIIVVFSRVYFYSVFFKQPNSFVIIYNTEIKNFLRILENWVSKHFLSHLLTTNKKLQLLRSFLP